MENPIKENRLVCDQTFATRFLSFARSVTVSDACAEDEKESMISYAKKLLTYQCNTVSDGDEKNYLKRVGSYDTIKPMLVTEDGVEIYEHLQTYTLHSCMKSPNKGDQLLTIRVRNLDDINRRNANRIYFSEIENCKVYMVKHTPNISRADLENLGLLEQFNQNITAAQKVDDGLDVPDYRKPFDTENAFISCMCKNPKTYPPHLGDGGYDWCKICNQPTSNL